VVSSREKDRERGQTGANVGAAGHKQAHPSRDMDSFEKTENRVFDRPQNKCQQGLLHSQCNIGKSNVPMRNVVGEPCCRTTGKRSLEAGLPALLSLSTPPSNPTRRQPFSVRTFKTSQVFTANAHSMHAITF